MCNKRVPGVLAVAGCVKNEGSEQIATACYGLIDEGVKDFVINLQQCEIVNRMGVSCPIAVIEKVEDLAGSVGFCNEALMMAKTFKIAAFYKHRAFMAQRRRCWRDRWLDLCSCICARLAIGGPFSLYCVVVSCELSWGKYCSF